jgi:putative membrane protein
MRVSNAVRFLSFLTVFALGSTRVGAVEAAESEKRSQSSTADAEVLDVLAAINENEVNAAEEALKKSDLNPRVLDYAAMMQKEHGANLDKTQRLAIVSSAVTSDTENAEKLRAKGASDLTALKPLDGVPFDAAYMDMMVRGHGEALEIINNDLLRRVENAEVRKHLQETRDRVAVHLEEAKRIQSELLP